MQHPTHTPPDFDSEMISDDTLRLRPTRPDELPWVLAAENDSVNAQWVLQWSHEHHRSLIDQDDVLHLIVETFDGVPVGYVILRGLATERGPVEFKRIVILDKGRGFGRRTLRLLKQLVFDQLGRHRLWLNVFPDNLRARSLYLSEGFLYEGTWRDHHPNEQGYRSMELMAMLSSDWQAENWIENQGERFQIVHALTDSQIARLFDLYQAEWPGKTRTVEHMKHAVAGSDYVIAVLAESGQLVGFCRVISDRGFRAWILGLVVDPAYRRRGFGRMIMDRILSSPDVTRAYSIGLSCHEHVISFYEQFGFTIREGEVVMNLELGRQPAKKSDKE